MIDEITKAKLGIGISLIFITAGISGIVISEKFLSGDNRINFGSIAFFTLAFALIGLFNFACMFKTAKEEANRVKNTRDNSSNEQHIELSSISNRDIQVTNYQSTGNTK